jgi:hypothetical protein
MLAIAFTLIISLTNANLILAQFPPPPSVATNCGVVFGAITENTMFIEIIAFKEIGTIRLAAIPDPGFIPDPNSCSGINYTFDLGAMIRNAASQGLRPDGLGSYSIEIPITFYQVLNPLSSSHKACVYLDDLNPPECALVSKLEFGGPFTGTIDLR